MNCKYLHQNIKLFKSDLFDFLYVYVNINDDEIQNEHENDERYYNRNVVEKFSVELALRKTGNFESQPLFGFN